MIKKNTAKKGVKKKGLRISVFWQMTAGMSLLVIFALGGLWLALQTNLKDLLQQQANTFGQAMAQQTAEGVAEMVLADDSFGLNVMLANVIDQNETIVQVAIYNDQGQRLAWAENPEHLLNEHEVENFIAPIRFQDVIAGQLYLDINNTLITASVQKTITILGTTIGVAVILMIALATYLARKWVAPVIKLRKVADLVATGKLEVELPNARNDEIGDLVVAFDHMISGLKDKQSIEHRFNSYMSKDVATNILSDLKQAKMPNEFVEASILFVDIVGFTNLCEQDSPEGVADLLNQYYFLIHQAAKMYRGTVDKYIGDGAMVTFGVNKKDKKHPINAICAAQIFIRLVEALNKQRHGQKLPKLEFRLGIHCGEVLAGTIGSLERMEYTVVGDAVNVAARLCSKGSPGTLIISENVYQHPEVNGLITIDNHRPLKVKGKSEPINCYDVCYLAPKFNRLLMQQESEMIAMQINA